MHVKGSAQWLAPSKGSIKGCYNRSLTLVSSIRNLLKTKLPNRTKINCLKDISLSYENQRIIRQPSYGKNKEESESYRKTRTRT